MEKFENYANAEHYLQSRIVNTPDFITSTTHELIGTGFVLNYPYNNRNTHSNYEYAMEFFKWMESGEKQLSDKIVKMNPWVIRFVESAGLPETFSSSYGWKIKEQITGILEELKLNGETRRAYVNILSSNDQIILRAKTRHEFPCTIGFQLFIREKRLFMIVNMRSNNCWNVMPYDVFNFTMLQMHLAEQMDLLVGSYHHQINNAHMFKGDIRRFLTLNQNK